MRKTLYLSAVLLGLATAPAIAQTVEQQTTVVTKKPSGGAAAGAVTGAATGAAVGGPVGAAVGAVAGAIVGSSADPPKEVRTYVTSQSVAPVAYSGPIVVGKPLTGTVSWLDVPNYPKYRWAYVGSRRVVIDRDTGNVVAVYGAAPPAPVHTYVMRQTGPVVTYGQPLVIGGTVAGDVRWLDVPDYPAYRWAYIDGRRVVVDATTNTVVSID
jgi:hypothetical protein